ncbi:MAG TPA: polysaccharide deacetylase family protein [Bryobacteraceae bacterium]|nr:polysaccharide deacetylase family protein [Bryobacteraceae bacterium]
MNITRRQFGFVAGAAALAAKTTAPQVAITMDDVNWQAIPGADPEKANRAILGALAAHSNLRAAIFVCGKFVDNDTGRQLVRAWSDAGHIVGNHTYSHPFLPNITAPAFIQDLERGEAVIRDFPGFQKMFRFPYLKEGDTASKRDEVRAYLASHGYRTGHVTIDASDWYYDNRFRERLAKDPSVDKRRYRDAYLAHIWDRAMYYDGLARNVLGHAVPHTLLIHYNLLNVLFLGDLLDMFVTKGWQLVSAQAAFQDPVFTRQPDIVPAGESLIWALAKADPRFAAKLRYPGEDDVYEKPKLDRLGL